MKGILEERAKMLLNLELIEVIQLKKKMIPYSEKKWRDPEKSQFYPLGCRRDRAVEMRGSSRNNLPGKILYGRTE